MRRLPQLIAIAVILVSACHTPFVHKTGASIPESKSDDRPNIILIYADDLGWRDLGVYGSHYYETPHIDKLAREGVLFTNAYAAAPNCSPSRASLLTGQYTPRHGIYTAGSPERGLSKNRRLIPSSNNTSLGVDSITLAERLREGGYTSASIGKWHLGTDPVVHGFDIALAGNEEGEPGSYYCPFSSPERTVPDLSESCREGDYLTDNVTDLAVEFILDNQDAPFFLYLPYYAVHSPIEGHPTHISRFDEKESEGNQQNAQYASMIYSLDQGVGRIIQLLETTGLSERTLIIFHSDNGGHGPTTDMYPLRGSKGMLYEGGIRVPLIMRWPGMAEANMRVDEPVISIDLYPTILEIADLPANQTAPLDGQSLWGILSGKEDPLPRALYWHFPAYLEGYEDKAYSSDVWRTTPAGAVRYGRYKLIEWFETGRQELYDLEDDVGENKNIAFEQPEIAADLHVRMRAWREEVGAPVPQTLNPDYLPRPNIIYIFADDLGYGELGSYGQQHILTPNLDRLAAEGMRFTQHYSGSPVCAPSRAALLTGHHTGHGQIKDNYELGGFRDEEERGQMPLNAGTFTVAGMLQSAGYRTAAIGKWGLGAAGTEGAPNNHGFDLFFGYLDQKQAHNYYPTHLWRNGERVALNNEWFHPHQQFEGDPDDPAAYDKYKGEDYAVDFMTDEARQFIAEHQDEPFFLYLAYPIPHVALQVPDEALAVYDNAFEENPPYLGDNMYLPHPRPRAAYAAMITLMDAHIGRILSQLEAQGLAENTIVMFASDNGPTYVSGVDVDFFNSTDGLRGLKGSVYEGGIRVPMIARWPGRIEAGSVTDHVSAIWDLMPTLGELLDLDYPDDIDGESFLPTLLGQEQAEHGPLYWEYHGLWDGAQAVRMGKWKAVRLGGHNNSDAPVELYDLSADRTEANNIAAEHPDMVAEAKKVFNSRTPSHIAEWNFSFDTP